ncbi:hypothetical protein B1748_19505 [Paenibacillus sp. MY03]|uniref:extracellular solute-binding protein n=1 Tax=Paenibacillus sp. MY03 TaxID=302980 RepID=UPI000B3C29BF|nr:extracellular solute-binding protein [Paenibacillus sp. MY03]OUS75087.1 hypothetical protein B1748_19505 [Paenibacillus sp. MY03]
MKKSVKWKVLTAVLAVIMLLSACTNGGGNNKPSTGGETSAPSGTASSAPTEQAEEPINLLWLSFDPPEGDETPVQKFLEERFNVKIENMRVDRTSWTEHLNIRLATGEVPDLFFLWSQGEILDYSNQGLLAELPIDLIREKMPKYAASVDEMDPSIWDLAVVDGKNFAIPLYWLEGLTPFMPAYNGDWLKAAGFDKAPETLEEFEKVVYYFAKNDPDKNGKADTIGYSGSGKDSLATLAFNSVYSAYGTSPGAWLKAEDGSLVNAMVTERTREALKVLNKWYKDGVIDKEFLTTDYAKTRQDLANRRSGIIDRGMWNSYSIAIGPEFKGQNPDTELVVGKPLVGPYGDNAGFSWGVKNNFVGMGAQVAKDPKKMDKLFEILEAMVSDEEVYKMTYFGVEGEHYDLVDGVPTPKEQYVNVTERGAKVGASSYYNIFGTKSSYMSQFDLSKEQAAFKKQTTEGVPAFSSLLTFIVPETSQYPDLNRIRDEHLIKFIIGEINLDQGFDDFVKLWNSSGGEALTKAVNDRYAALQQ